MVKITVSSKIKFRLIILLSALSFVAVGVGMYFLSKLANTVKNSKVRVAEINRDIALLDRILEDKKQYAGDIQKAKYSFPASYYEISFFTQQLERLAQNTGVTLQISIDKERVEEREQYDSVVFTIKLGGSYSAVSEFLTQIAKLPYHTSVDLLKMSAESGSPTANVRFRLFIEK